MRRSALAVKADGVCRFRYDPIVDIGNTEDIVGVTEEFGLGEVLEIGRMAQGNAPAYRVRTARGVYLVKGQMGGSEQWARLYRPVAKHLNEAGVRQAAMLLSRGGRLIGAAGHGVFEFLPGDAVQRPDEEQFVAHVHHLLRYQQALGTFGLCPAQIDELVRPEGIWRRAASVDYLLDGFDLDGGELQLDGETEAIARRALGALAGWRKELAGLPRQLVHADIGPGNILYDGRRVVSIIDFTPAYEPGLYGLCISLFWHCVFEEPEDVAQRWITAAARIYAEGWPAAVLEGRCFYPLMLRAAAYRLFARLIARKDNGIGPNGEAAPFSAGSTQRMAGCVDRVMRWEGLLRSCM